MKKFRRCETCGKWFAMKETEKTLVGKEDIKIFERLTQPHLKGQVEKVVDRFVPGERFFYDVTYRCRFCGAEVKESVFEDVKK